MDVDEVADRLAAIGHEYASRVRDDSPADFHAWLREQMGDPWLREQMGAGEERWIGLVTVLAAAVPIDEPWRLLTAWAWAISPKLRAELKAEGLQPPRPGLQPCGTRAGAERHRRLKEKICGPCRLAATEYFANQHRPKATQPELDEAASAEIVEVA